MTDNSGNRPLSEDEETLLRDIVASRCPNLIPAVAKLWTTPLSSDERTGLEEALSTELTATGFNDDWTLTTRGEMVEDLIHMILEVAP